MGIPGGEKHWSPPDGIQKAVSGRRLPDQKCREQFPPEPGKAAGIFGSFQPISGPGRPGASLGSQTSGCIVCAPLGCRPGPVSWELPRLPRREGTSGRGGLAWRLRSLHTDLGSLAPELPSDCLHHLPKASRTPSPGWLCGGPREMVRCGLQRVSKRTPDISVVSVLDLDPATGLVTPAWIRPSETLQEVHRRTRWELCFFLLFFQLTNLQAVVNHHTLYLLVYHLCPFPLAPH